MSKAILIIDDIPENLFTENLSIKYQLIYYPDGHMKELGRHGKRRLRPMPEKKNVGEIETVSDYMKSDISQMIDGLYASITLDTELLLATGYNRCIDEILGEEE